MVCPDHAPTTQAREHLEALYRQSWLVYCYRQATASLRGMGIALLHELTRDRNAPHITKRYTAAGEPVWRVYDPVTQQRAVCFSEAEVRTWLEGRYAK